MFFSNGHGKNVVVNVEPSLVSKSGRKIPVHVNNSAQTIVVWKQHFELFFPRQQVNVHKNVCLFAQSSKTFFNQVQNVLVLVVVAHFRYHFEPVSLKRPLHGNGKYCCRRPGNCSILLYGAIRNQGKVRVCHRIFKHKPLSIFWHAKLFRRKSELFQQAVC